MRDLKISATVPQAAFHSLKCRYPAFVGGFGCGKTETMINQAIIDASHAGDAFIAMYEPTLDLVRLNLAPRLLIRLDKLGIKYTFNKSEMVITTHSNQFGNFIFRSLDRPEMIIGYQSYSSHIDELDTLPMEKAREVWQKVLGRNRQQPELLHQDHQVWDDERQKYEAYNRAYVYTTPEGFKFVYDQWVAKKTDDYRLIRAKTSDNPFNPRGYEQTLRDAYPPALIDAYINGEFVNLTSGTVYSSYNRTTHDSHERIIPGENLYIGCDFNVMKQAATVYVRRNAGKDWHAVEELTNMRDTPDMIESIQSRYKEHGHHIVMYPDASGSARKTVNASLSDIALLKSAGFEVRAHKSNPDVRDRVNATNKAFAEHRIFINQSMCPTVAKCLEQQAYDSNGMPDKKSGSDHQNDATTYPIAYEMSIKKPMFAIDFSFSI